MQADASLDPAIRPDAAASQEPTRVILLTGASGFLGRKVARELLYNPQLRVVCLVRDRPGERGAQRLARALESTGVDPAVVKNRVEALAGDVAEPDLGLSPDSFAALAGRIDMIYHCAALVDWVRGYHQLYRMNVGGVLNLIRLACRGRAKRMVFVSSIAVCYARGGPEVIDETTDMLPFAAGMPLGYARSKCVAESLLRQAAERGLPVTVLRPALIAGDSATGVSNSSDLIAALIQGCVATSMAIDTDWLLDCVPVDFVARVVARAPQGASNHQVLNLMHERPRHWRELILWMNLHGYPVDLVESEAWIRHLFEHGHGRDTLLYSQRRFFSGRGEREGHGEPAKPYETYLAASQRQIDTKRTRALLNGLGLSEPPLDADLLHAYFDHYRRAGVLPGRDLEDESNQGLDELWRGDWRANAHGPEISVWRAARPTRIGSDDGLLSEIAAARVKSGVGLWRLDPEDGMNAPARAVLKAKVSDTVLTNLSIRLADVCRTELGTLFARHPEALGLSRSHERELALYELDEPLLRRHMPKCFATLRDSGAGRWAVILEHLPEAETGPPHLRPQFGDVEAVVAGLAEIHGVGYRQREALASQPWWAPVPDAARMGDMLPLWRELADFAAPWFVDWCGPGIRALQRDYLDSLPDWWPRLQALPSTLIHNDFNPRNFVLRDVDGQRRLCVFDWELATWGPPQHDLAELLSFIWCNDWTTADLTRIVERYRAVLSQTAQIAFDPPDWRCGFALALRHLLLNRLAMYTLMHRFRPLSFLPTVLTNWARLEAASREWSDSAR